MGSVSSYGVCPNCGNNEMYEECWYKTGEEFMSCNQCGYHFEAFFRRDEKGCLVLKDDTKGINGDNLFMDVKKIDKPFGAYRIQFKEKGAQCGTLETEQHYAEFLTTIEAYTTTDNEPEIDFVQVNRYVDGVHTSEDIYGVNPIHIPINTQFNEGGNEMQDYSLGKCECNTPEESKQKYCNLHKEQWAYCETCMTKWLYGTNIFSSWQHETQEDWDANRLFLNQFKDITHE